MEQDGIKKLSLKEWERDPNSHAQWSILIISLIWYKQNVKKKKFKSGAILFWA